MGAASEQSSITFVFKSTQVRAEKKERKITISRYTFTKYSRYTFYVTNKETNSSNIITRHVGAEVRVIMVIAGGGS